jgi:hypothetical protein
MLISAVFIAGFFAISLFIVFGVGSENQTTAFGILLITALIFGLTLKASLGPIYALSSQYWTITYLTLQKKSNSDMQAHVSVVE